MSTETWLQSLIRAYTATHKQGQPARPTPAAQNYARPVYGPAPKPVYGPPPRPQNYAPSLPFNLPRFEADPASRAPAPVTRPPVYRVTPPAFPLPRFPADPVTRAPAPAPQRDLLNTFLPTPGGWGQPTEAAKKAYEPIRKEHEAERAAEYERISGLPYDAGRPELKTVNPLVKKLITTVLPNGENLVTAYEGVIQVPQRIEQAERIPVLGDVFRALHYGAVAGGSYLGQAAQALAGLPLGTLEGEATRDPAFRAELAQSPAGRLLSPAARQQAMAPFLALSALTAKAIGQEQVIPILAGLQDPIVPTTTSPQQSVEQALPTYLNRYSPTEQFVAEMAAGWPLDPLAVAGMGAKASQAAKLRRFTSELLPGMQGMVGDLTLLDRFMLATAKGLNEGKAPLLGWFTRHTPKTEVYLSAQDALTYGGWLTEMLPPNAGGDDVARAINSFLSNPDALTGGAQRARQMANILSDFDAATLPAIQEAIEKGLPVNLPKVWGELSDTVFMRNAAAKNMLKQGKNGEWIFIEPIDQRFVRWLKDIESAFLLGTPRYVVRNFTNNVFTAAFDGYGVGRSMDDAVRLAREVPIANQQLYSSINDVPVKGSNAFIEYVQGKGWNLSQKLPWSRAVRHVASESRIGENQARVRVFGDAVGKLKDDYWTNAVDLGRGSRGLRPIASPDVSGPHAGLVNQVLARNWNVSTARAEIANVLNGGTRPPLDALLPQRLYLQPDMLTALNTAWKNAKTKDDFMRVLDRADNLIRQQAANAAATGAHADITQVGQAVAPVAEQMAATIVPGVPATREIAEQVAQAEVGRIDGVLQNVGQAIQQGVTDSTSAERAANGVNAILHRLQYQWTSDYIEANRLLNVYNAARQNVFEQGLKGEAKTRALEAAWNNYERAITQHWQRHHAQAEKLTNGLLGQFGDMITGKAPLGSFDQRAAERAIEHLRRNTPELMADKTFLGRVTDNRQSLGYDREAALMRLMGYVAKTGDTTPVAWIADAVAEERRLTDAAVGEITGMRATMRKDGDWPDIAAQAWDAANLDQRSVWRAFLKAINDADKTGTLTKPRFNEYTELLRLTEANDRVSAFNKLAKEAGIATATKTGAPEPHQLANFVNRAFKDAGLTDEALFVVPEGMPITRAWRDWLSELDDGEVAVALRAFKGREALTPIERMIGQQKSIPVKQYIRQYADWLQGDQTLPMPGRGKLTEAQASAWRKKVDDLIGPPEQAPAPSPAPIVPEASPTSMGEAPPTIAPALQAARDSNVQLAEQIGVKDEILQRAAEGQDAGTIARDLRAEGALPESYDFQPGEPAAQMEPLTSTDRAVVKSVIEAEPPAVAPKPDVAVVVQQTYDAPGYKVQYLDKSGRTQIARTWQNADNGKPFTTEADALTELEKLRTAMSGKRRDYDYRIVKREPPAPVASAVEAAPPAAATPEQELKAQLSPFQRKEQARRAADEERIAKLRKAEQDKKAAERAQYLANATVIPAPDDVTPFLTGKTVGSTGLTKAQIDYVAGHLRTAVEREVPDVIKLVENDMVRPGSPLRRNFADVRTKLPQPITIEIPGDGTMTVSEQGQLAEAYVRFATGKFPAGEAHLPFQPYTGVTGKRTLPPETAKKPIAELVESRLKGTVTDHGDGWYTVDLPDEQGITAQESTVRRWLDNMTRQGVAAPGTEQTQRLLSRLFGDPRPSATHVARTEAEGQLWELGQLRQAADRMWNTAVMPASKETKAATLKWFDEVAVPQTAAAKTMISHMAQAATDEILLDYGRTRNMDRMLDLIFPYHYWTTHSGWNWAKRAAHHPFMLGTYIKSRKDRMEERKSDNGLRPRFWNSLKLKFPWLPDYFEDYLYFNPDAMVMPFGELRLPDWDDAEQANTAWGKALNVTSGLGLAPHVPAQALIMHGEGQGWGGVRDYIPQWDAAAAMLPPSKWTFGPGAGGSRWDVYRVQRMLASMAADLMRLPNVDYNNPEELLAASQRAGKGDISPLMPYLAAQKMIEAWGDGQLTPEQIDALFDDPLIKEAIRRTWEERRIPVLSSFLTGLPMRPVTTGETTQVATQNAKYAMSYGGEVAGEQGLRQNATDIGAANPFERARWSVYGSLPGEPETTADNVYWMTYEDAGMQDIEQRFDALEEALIQQNPGNHELFSAYQTERFSAADALEQSIPKDKQKPYLWSIIGASPTEAAQIRQNQIVYLLYKTKPKPNEFEQPDGKTDWDAWNAAVEKWNQDLPTLLGDDPVVKEALAFFPANERAKVMAAVATKANMDAYSRGFDGPLVALHKTVWDAYYQPVRDYMAAAEKQYGTDIFDRQAQYFAEIRTRYGDNIFDLQDDYFKQKQGSKARREFLKAYPQLKGYWDNKDAIARRFRVLAFLENKSKLLAKIPQTFKGGPATGFVDAVLAAYPEKKWTREELLKLYATVKAFGDKDYMKAIADFEQERLEAFYAAKGVSPNRAREGAWTDEEIRKAVESGQALPLDTIPEELATGMATPETPAIVKAVEEARAREAAIAASKGKRSGGRSSGRRYYSRRYYSRRGGGGGGGSAPIYRPYLPGFTPGATKERRRVYVR